ncbi:hypothetical protein POJ06DRAFT_25347 [Lipomyces tetrasporus]|uniref:PH domain-containing protein n=1 Tax=Lipomyces tetrasporus TaxID=54092 RepID=A0AAD7VQT5_9ASCO|nr:uncharacterized protein POJ06DRAFT_25347 [Lipomyces tetrasporus]KAJ8097929.1 hypothetical protein POJ06DRAFT_25347 [Lipomyces tetrasporus]
MSGVVVSAPPGVPSYSAVQSQAQTQSRPRSIENMHSQSVITARVVPQHSPAAVSALADNISTLSISPRTPIPPQLQLRNQNQQGTTVPASSASAVVRASTETDERSSMNNDVIIRNGWLLKRGKRWTWARRWFVLRPAQLTIYKNDSEYKAADIIPISDINTAAILSEKSDSKRKAHFAIFTPSRNYHLQANTPVEAEDWVTDIKMAVRLAEQQLEFLRRQSAATFRAPNFQGSAENVRSSENLAGISPSVPQLTVVPVTAAPSDQTDENAETVGRPSLSDDHHQQHQQQQQHNHHRQHHAYGSHHVHGQMLHNQHQQPQHEQHEQHQQQHHPRQRLASPIESDLPLSPTTAAHDSIARSRSPDQSIHNGSSYEFSGAEDLGFSSGASEYGVPISSANLRNPSDIQLSAPGPAGQPRTSTSTADNHVAHDLAQLEKDRVLESGYLLRLVRRYNQWRRKWVVLRKGSLAFYKSEDEYKPLKIIPLDHIIDVMEIDPMSRSKQYCLQVILPEKRLRLCADTEEDLTRWLVAIKAAVVRYKKEMENNEHK